MSSNQSGPRYTHTDVSWDCKYHGHSGHRAACVSVTGKTVRWSSLTPHSTDRWSPVSCALSLPVSLLISTDSGTLVANWLIPFILDSGHRHHMSVVLTLTPADSCYCSLINWEWGLSEGKYPPLSLTTEIQCTLTPIRPLLSYNFNNLPGFYLTMISLINKILILNWNT